MLRWINAFAGIIVALLLLAFAAYQAFGWGLGWVAAPLGLVGVALGAGDVLTLASVKRGSRVLAGAWGVVAGMFFGSGLGDAIESSLDPAFGQGSYSVDPGAAAMLLLISLPYVAVVGVLLAVMQRE